MAQCLLAFYAWTVLDWRGTWSLVSRVLRRDWWRSALATQGHVIPPLLIGFHLMHASEAAFHALHVVVNVWRALHRLIIVIITHAAATSVTGLETSHPCRGLVNLVESVRRPRVRGCLLFWRSHILQRGHHIVHCVCERRRCELLWIRRRRFWGGEAVLWRRCR